MSSTPGWLIALIAVLLATPAALFLPWRRLNGDHRAAELGRRKKDPIDLDHLKDTDENDPGLTRRRQAQTDQKAT
jgi:hypothetical protein